MAVAGFDGTELAEMVSPPLTTLSQPSKEIGRHAFRLLCKKIDHPAGTPERVIMQGQLIKRASA